MPKQAKSTSAKVRKIAANIQISLGKLQLAIYGANFCDVLVQVRFIIRRYKM